ncbi:MAG: ATPase, T2SS/T4P/T4SS family [Bdellovibrionales bacterium]
MAIAKNCHLISITSGKGGVGKSIFSSNISVALRAEFKAPVLLVDLDVNSCGDQSILLGVKPEKSIMDLARSKQSLSQKTLEQFVVKHSSGVHYLAAVSDPSQSLTLDADTFSKQISAISQFYKYIVVDLGSNIESLQSKALELSSVALTLTTPDILTVNQTKKFLNKMVSETFPIELFKIVVNQASPAGLRPDAISKALALPVNGIIPQDDVSVTGALNKNQPFVQAAPRSPISSAYFNLVRKITGGQLDRARASFQSKSSKKLASSSDAGDKAVVDNDIQLKLQIHNELIKEMDLKKDVGSTQNDPQKEKELRQKTQLMVTKIVDKRASGLGRDERTKIIKDVLDEALGLGALENLLADDSVSEIMVNGAEKIFVEKDGRVQLSKSRFTSNQQLRNVIERIVTPIGRRIDEKTPYCDARLADGSRVNAVIEPLAIDGPSLTIRKFSKDEITYKNYLEWGSMTQPMIDFLRICVEQGLNIIISGGTGSGKTTILNTMSGFIPANERIVTVEDAAELQLKQEHVVRLETRPANMDGGGEISIRDLVKNSLRMRPDRVIVGECRDGAALDMLQAMNTGHDGSMTTVHANTPKEAIGRLETLCLMAGMDLPAKAIREQIAGAVNLFVQIGRLSDGSRKVKYITEVGAFRGEVIELQDIFIFKEEGFDKNRKIQGSFKWTGNMPKCVEKFEKRGVTIPRSIFSTSADSQPDKKEGPVGIKKPGLSAAKPKAAPVAKPKAAVGGVKRPPLKKVSGGN